MHLVAVEFRCRSAGPNVCPSVRPLATNKYCGKTADSIETTFGLVDRVGPSNHCSLLDEVQITQSNGQILGKWGGTVYNVNGECVIGNAQMAEPIELPFWMVSEVGQRSRVLA